MAPDTGKDTAQDTARGFVWEARKLLRSARVGTLASSADGQPFASLVTPASAPDLSLLLLLSDMSEHTRHLRADARCSVLVAGAPQDANPQTTPRVTVTGVAEPAADAALKSRYLAVHPYAAQYADFGDFSLWRIRPLGGLYVGGFARAARLRAADLALEAAAVATIADAEARIMSHCNNDHPDALAAIAGSAGTWRMVAVDVDGCDLADGERAIRIHWSEPVAGSADVRRELVRLTGEARAG
jgi:putative heme iron utilization protein